MKKFLVTIISLLSIFAVVSCAKDNYKTITEEEFVEKANKLDTNPYTYAKGEYVIDPQFADARSFSNGLAAVFDGKKWGFINKDCELAIAYQFNDVGYFNKQGCCMVLNEELDPKGKVVKTYWQLISLYVI